MGVYFINLGFVIILGLLIFITGSSEMKKKIYVVVAFISIFLVAGLRDVSVGTDTIYYQQLFASVVNTDISNLFGAFRVEPGYLLLNKVLSIFTSNPQAITLLNSAIIVLCFAIFVYNNSENVCLATFLFLTIFYFCVSLNTSRQFIAVALVYNSFYFFKRGKIKSFIAIILLASTFHFSSLSSLLMLTLKLIKPKSINFIRVSLISLGIGIVLLFSNDIIINLSSKYQVYIGTLYFEEKAVRGAIIIWACQLCLACVTMYFLTRNNKLENVKNDELYYLSLFMIFSVTMGLIGTKLFIFSRMTYYFGGFMIILIPKVVNQFKRTRILLIFFMFVLLTFYYYYMLRSGTEGVVPYKVFWLG